MPIVRNKNGVRGVKEISKGCTAVRWGWIRMLSALIHQRLNKVSVLTRGKGGRKLFDLQRDAL